MFIIESLSNDSTSTFCGVEQNTSKQKKTSYTCTCRHYTSHFGIIARARDWSQFGKIDQAVSVIVKSKLTLTRCTV